MDVVRKIEAYNLDKLSVFAGHYNANGMSGTVAAIHVKIAPTNPTDAHELVRSTTRGLNVTMPARTAHKK